MGPYRKKIVFVIPSVLSERHQVDSKRYAFKLIKAMISLRKDIEVVLLGTGYSMNFYSEIQKEFSELLPPSKFSFFECPAPSTFSAFPNSPFSEFSQKLFERHLFRLNPDGIFFLGPIESQCISSEINPFSNFFPSVALLLDPRQLIFSGSGPGKKIEWIRSIDLLLVPSETAEKDAINLFGVIPKNIFRISGGIDCFVDSDQLDEKMHPEIFSRQRITREFILGEADGGWTPKLYDLVVAFSLLPVWLRKKTMFVIICEVSTETYQSILSFIEKTELTVEDIILTGTISEAERVALFKQAKLFLIPDGIAFSQSLIEAISFGTPALVPINSGLMGIVKNQDALFDPTTPEFIANSIFRVLNDESLRRSLLNSCRNGVSELSWEKCAHKVWEKWLQLTEKNLQKNGSCLSEVEFQKRKIACIVPPKFMDEVGMSPFINLLEELKLYYELDLYMIKGEGLENIADFSHDSNQSHLSSYAQVIYFVNKDQPLDLLLEMLLSFPGIVILLDFFLGSSYVASDTNSDEWGFLPQEALRCHGTIASWLALDRSCYQEFFQKYPLNRRIFDEAVGVIICDPGIWHQIHFYYPEGVNAKVTYSPRPVVLPKGMLRKSYKECVSRSSVNTFSICFIGSPDTEEHWIYFLAALRYVAKNFSNFSARIMLHSQDISLFFEKIEEKTVFALNPICIIPIEDNQEVSHCFISSDLGIILKDHSVNREWATFLDAMSLGLPLLICSEFLGRLVPETSVINIPSNTLPERFDEILQGLMTESSVRESCSEKASKWIQEYHLPRRVAEGISKIFDQYHRDWIRISDVSLATSLSDYLKKVPWQNRRDEAERLSFIAANSEPLFRSARLYIDVTVFIKSLKKGYITGIQRVIQNICRLLPLHSKTPVDTFRIGLNGQQSFFLNSVPLDSTADKFWKTPFSLSLRPGDLILLPDALMDPDVYESFLSFCHNRGALLHVIVYDLLPLRLSDCFNASHVDSFRRWLEITLRHVDKVLCDSKSTAEDLMSFLKEETIKRTSPLKIGSFRLGADLLHSPRNQPFENMIPEKVIDFFTHGKAPVFLMVGTVEPRKNHAFVLDVFEKLWSEGVQSRLCIVGRIGWNVQSIVNRLKNHEERGLRLLFLEGAPDSLLDYSYQKSSALIMASLGEGFGLPVIEGARRGLPIVVNDIPIFRETCAENAMYFLTKTPESLASLIRNWSDLCAQGFVPDPAKIQWATWKECAEDLCSLIHEPEAGLFEYP